jgi:hypothetical protein
MEYLHKIKENIGLYVYILKIINLLLLSVELIHGNYFSVFLTNIY